MNRPDRPLRLGTRGSPLALAQAQKAAAALVAANGWDEGSVEIMPMITSGDQRRRRRARLGERQRRAARSEAQGSVGAIHRRPLVNRAAIGQWPRRWR